MAIARKISFGSQSEKGAETRGILMSVLHTFAKRRVNALEASADMLDALVDNPKLGVAECLFGGNAAAAAPS